MNPFTLPPQKVEIVLLVMLLAAAIFDVLYRRIPNWLTVSGVVLGIAINTILGSEAGAGLVFSLVGLLVAFGIYAALYADRNSKLADSEWRGPGHCHKHDPRFGGGSRLGVLAGWAVGSFWHLCGALRFACDGRRRRQTHGRHRRPGRLGTLVRNLLRYRADWRCDGLAAGGGPRAVQEDVFQRELHPQRNEERAAGVPEE